MAKKGGVQQLQLEINTDEELSKFLDKDGLIIMDVYTEWCGPCLAMVGSLKKIKLEKGGDDLQLAVVKCDQIEVLKRFRNKCEPTWLFVSKGKIVNCAFGSNVPKLMSMISAELDLERKCRDGQAERVYYELTEMCSVELERYNAKKAQDEEIDKIEREAAEAKRRAYIIFVTDQIMKNAGDMGVSIHMPHLITRDLFKRMTEQGDKFGLQAKDKKNSLISDNDLEVLHFEIENPLPPYVLRLLKKKEAFMICWKTAEFEERSITSILMEMTQLLAEEQPVLDEHGNVSLDVKKPAILKSQSIILTDDELKELGMNVASEENVFNYEITEEEENDTNSECEDIPNQNAAENSDLNDIENSGQNSDENPNQNSDENPNQNGNENFYQNGEIDEENLDEEHNMAETEDSKEDNDFVNEINNEDTEATNELDSNVITEIECKNGDEVISPSESNPAVIVEVEPVNKENTPIEIEKPNEVKQKQLPRPISGHKFKIPPMWTPANPHANAAFIYVFFRHLTETFLPPDPIPVPPHVAVAFDAYKRREIMEVMEQHGEAILAYGYFTSDDITTATLIANSTFKYNLETPTINDKLFVKVAKKIGNALASLIELSPCHVSQNSEIGYEECIILFPLGYKNASETGVEPKEPEEEIESKKKKKKKNKKTKEEQEKEEESREATDGGDDDGDEDDDDDESELDDENVEECND